MIGWAWAPQLTTTAASRMAFDADYDHVLTMQSGAAATDSAIEAWLATASSLQSCVGCLAFGVSTLTGFRLAVEIGDWTRFTGNTIGSFVD